MLVDDQCFRKDWCCRVGVTVGVVGFGSARFSEVVV